VENAGSAYGLTPGSYDFADSERDAEERSRSAALRARIAILAAGPDPEPPGSAPPLDIAATVSEAVRASLPGLLQEAVRASIGDAIRDSVREEVGAAVSAALPGLVGQAAGDALAQQRSDVMDVVGRQVTELRAAVVANATMPSPGPDALLVEMASLRSDVARALDTIHQHVAEYVAERFSEIRVDLRSDINAEVTRGHAVVVDRIRRGLIGQVNEALLSIQSEFAATAQAHRANVSTLSEEVRGLVAEQIEAIRHASGEIDFLGDNLRSTLTAYADEQLAVLEAAADRSGGGVADLSADVRRQLETFSIRVAHELQNVVVAGRESLGSIGPSVRGDVQALTGAIRADVDALTGGVREDLEGLVVRLRREVETLAASVRTDVDGLTARTKADIERLGADVRSSLARDLEAAIVAAREGAVAGAGAAVERGVGELRSVVAATEQELAASRSEVALFSDRFAKAGQALLEHLAARDLLLEQARDELLAQLLTDLTSGMTGRDRSAAGARLSQITQRRRDARDAERWRAGRPPAPVLPADIKDENELVALLEAPLRAQAAGDPAETTGAAGGAAPGVTSAPLVAPELSMSPPPAAQRESEDSTADPTAPDTFGPPTPSW
jgi:hypothetical protein